MQANEITREVKSSYRGGEAMSIPQPEMLTAKQIAMRGLLPERTLRRLVKEEKIPTVKSGTTSYINYTRLCEELASGEGVLFT